MNDFLQHGLSLTPYPGLRPFRRDEADIFFGREQQVDQLLSRLESHRLLAVVGASGCGKSSLVRAGMLSALEGGFMASAGARWRVAEMRPGSRPLANLASAVQQSGLLDPQWRKREEASGFLLAALRRGPLGLAELLREPLRPDNSNLLLLVDQFEEIFRFRRHGDAEEAAEFVRLLLASARQQETGIYVVLTMRSDFLGDCAVFDGLPEAINDAQYLIPRMTPEQCRAAIVGPAAAFGARVAPELADRILEEIGADADQLPLMQHVLMRVWSRACEGSRRVEGGAEAETPLVMTLADYEAVGGLRDALSRHADELYDSLEESERPVAESLMRTLSERGADQRDTRRPTPLAEAAEVAQRPAAIVAKVADLFRRPDCSFLLPPLAIDLEPATVLDISHESLIRQWARMSQWVQAEADSAAIYRRLAETARLWKTGRAAVWTTPDLENALAWRQREAPTAAWARRYGGDFDLSMEFLDASVAAQEQALQAEEQRRTRELELLQSVALAEKRRADEAESGRLAQAVANRRLKTRATIAAVACAVSIVLAAVALILFAQARKERARADLAAAQSRKAAERETLARERAEATAQMARQAAQQADVERIRADAEWARSELSRQEAVRQSLLATHGVATANVERMKTLWAATERHRQDKAEELIDQTVELQSQAEKILSAPENNNEGALEGGRQAWRTLAADLRSETVRWLSETSLVAIGGLEVATTAEAPAAISPDGTRLAVFQRIGEGLVGGELQIIDLATREITARRPEPSSSYRKPAALQFSADGQSLLGLVWNISTQQKFVEVYNAADLSVAKSAPLRAPEGASAPQYFSLKGRFTRDGKTVVVVANDDITVWDAASGELRWKAKGMFHGVSGPGDGVFLSSAGEPLKLVRMVDGQVDEQESKLLPESYGVVPDNVFASGDGQWLAACGVVTYSPTGGNVYPLRLANLRDPARGATIELNAPLIAGPMGDSPLRIAFHPRLPLLAAVDGDRLVVIDAPSGAVVHQSMVTESQQQGVTRGPVLVEFAAGGDVLFAAVAEGFGFQATVRTMLWDFAAPALAIRRDKAASLTAAVPLADGAFALAKPGNEAAVQLVRPGGQSGWTNVAAREKSGFEPSGKHYVHVGQRQVEVHDAASGALMGRIERVRSPEAISKNRRYFVGIDRDGAAPQARLYDASSAAWSFPLSADIDQPFPFSDDEQFLAVIRTVSSDNGESNRRLAVMNCSTGEAVLEIPAAGLFRFTPAHFLVFDEQRPARAFRLDSGELVSQSETFLTGHEQPQAWDPAGEYFAYGAYRDEKTQVVVWRYAQAGPPIVLSQEYPLGGSLLAAPQRLFVIYHDRSGENGSSPGDWQWGIDVWDVKENRRLRQWRRTKSPEPILSPQGGWAMINVPDDKDKMMCELWDLRTASTAAVYRQAGALFSQDDKRAVLARGAVIDLDALAKGQAASESAPAEEAQGDKAAATPGPVEIPSPVDLAEEEFEKHTFSPDGRFLASNSKSGQLYIRDLQGDGETKQITSMAKPVFSPDGRLFATSSGCLVPLWDSVSIEKLRTIDTRSSSGLPEGPLVQNIEFSGDGAHLAITAGFRTRLAAVEQEKAHTFLSRSGHAIQVEALAVTADETLVVTGGGDKTVCFWNADDGRFRGVIEGFPSEIRHLSLHPQAPLVAVVDKLGTVFVWRYDAGGPESPLECTLLWREFAGATRTVFGPGGEWLAVDRADGWRLQDVTSGKTRAWWKPAQGGCGALAVDPQSGRVALGTSTGMICIWDSKAGKVERQWRSGWNAVHDLAFSPDGRVLAAAGDGLKFFDWRDGELLLSMRLHVGSTRDAAFDASGQWLVATADEGATAVLPWKELASELEGKKLALPASAAPTETIVESPGWRAASPEELDRMLNRASNLAKATQAELDRDWPTVARFLAEIIDSDSQDPDLWRRYGHACGESSQWREAARAFSKVWELRKDDKDSRYYHAVALLCAGDKEGWRTACQGLLNEYSLGSPASLVIYACIWAPDAVQDMPALVKLAEVDGGGLSAYALFRAGRLQEAKSLFERAAPESRTPWDLWFLAMAQHRLGEDAQAAESFAEADRRLQQRKQEIDGNWYLRTLIPVLRQEAQSVLAEPLPPAPE